MVMSAVEEGGFPIVHETPLVRELLRWHPAKLATCLTPLRMRTLTSGVNRTGSLEAKPCQRKLPCAIRRKPHAATMRSI